MTTETQTDSQPTTNTPNSLTDKHATDSYEIQVGRNKGSYRNIATYPSDQAERASRDFDALQVNFKLGDKKRLMQGGKCIRRQLP